MCCIELLQKTTTDGKERQHQLVYMTSWSIGRNLKVLKDRRVRGDQSSPTARLEKERFEGWVGLAKRRDRTMEREGYNWL